MNQRTQGVTTTKPFLFPAKDVIQEPQISIVTEAYPVGEIEYDILKQRYWVDWLNPFAFASLGVFLVQAYNLIAYLFQIYIHIGDTEEVVKLKESQGHEIGRTTIILILSGVVFVVLLIINKVVPTKKKKLLKDIRKVLERHRRIVASKRKGETCAEN